MGQQARFKDMFCQLRACLHDQAEEVGVRYEGVATHLIDIRNFYVVPLNRYKLLHIMEVPGTLMQDYSENSIVIYFSLQLDRHVRGMVTRVNTDGTCDIFAMDYGVTDAGVTPDKIFNPFHPEATEIPGLARLCELSMCYPKGPEFTKDAQECFKFFMGEKRESLLITVKEKNNQKLSVLVMSSNSNPDDVSTSMAFCHHSTYYGHPL